MLEFVVGFIVGVGVMVWLTKDYIKQKIQAWVTKKVLRSMVPRR